MNNNNKEEFKELVELTTERLGLIQPGVIEKDYYVTQALHAVSDIETDYFRLVFQGGTCLSKAHRLIERMSEDCDLRIQEKPESQELSKEAKRKQLREFRHELVAALKSKELIIPGDAVRTRNEGKFMCVNANYQSMYPSAKGLRPHLQMEFFLGEVKVDPQQLSTTTLIRQTLGNNVPHPEKIINCISVIETAAEKWVALTRRIATIKYRTHYRDPNLVRHLYDLYEIKQSGQFTEEVPELILKIVDDDRKQYKNHNNAYTDNPTREIKRALDELKSDKVWHENWEIFINTMVFKKDSPSYDSVLDNLLEISLAPLALLE